MVHRIRIEWLIRVKAVGLGGKERRVDGAERKQERRLNTHETFEISMDPTESISPLFALVGQLRGNSRHAQKKKTDYRLVIFDTLVWFNYLVCYIRSNSFTFAIRGLLFSQ